MTPEEGLRRRSPKNPVYTAWCRMSERDPAWDTFEDFVTWVEDAGYSLGEHQFSRLHSGPWGPGNCRLRQSSSPCHHQVFSDTEYTSRVRSWNRTVNRIRAAYHLPLFEEDD